MHSESSNDVSETSCNIMLLRPTLYQVHDSNSWSLGDLLATLRSPLGSRGRAPTLCPIPSTSCRTPIPRRVSNDSSQWGTFLLTLSTSWPVGLPCL